MGNYTYYCVSCGEEILPEQAADKMLISLSHAALDGAPETVIEKNPVFVTRKNLETLIRRTDSKGRQFLTLGEYLSFAYSRTNKGVLDPRKVKMLVDSIIKSQYREAPQEQTSEGGSSNTYIVHEENEEIKLPGFGETAVNQIRENFPRGVCYLKWSLNETKGYLYKLIAKPNAIQKITPFWVCSNCKEEILGKAFENRHILVGLLGFAKAGKTCLIASLCHQMVERGGVLMATKNIKTQYKELLQDYEGGYALEKTQLVGVTSVNTYHPSVLKDNVLWTFVDIPGETFFDGEKNQDINHDALSANPKLEMALKCHAYILTADQEVMHDDEGQLRSEIQNSLQNFVKFAEEKTALNIHGSPLMLTVTKVDEIDKSKDRVNLPGFCLQDSYPKSLRRELSIIRNTSASLLTLVDELSKDFYLTTMTCSAYGFAPLPADNVDKGIFVQRDNKESWKQAYREKNPGVEEEMIPHPVYKKAQPRNVDMILSWLEKLFGIQKIMYDSINGYAETQDLSTLRRFEGHFDDVTVSMIASMFCNPNDCDTGWYESMGESRFFRNRKRNQLMRKYKKKLQMG